MGNMKYSSYENGRFKNAFYILVLLTLYFVTQSERILLPIDF